MELNERRQLRKAVKKDGSKVGFSLLLYTVITIVVTTVWLVAQLIILNLTELKGVTDPDVIKAAEDRVINQFDQSGTSMIVAVLIGLVILFLLFLGRKTHREIFKKGESISFGALAGITCVFMGVQFVIQWVFELMEMGLNLIGYSAMSSMEAASSGSTTISMFIYAGIVGPIVEELIYRGFVMRALEKHGKTLAIVVSSILFGVMHGNIPQAVFASVVGIVLGYTAMRYSIVWSIILHIFNNLVMGDLLSLAISGLSEDIQNIIFWAVMGAFFLAGLIVLIVKRKKIRAYFRENKTEKPRMRWILCSAGMIIFIALNLLLGITMIEKIG